MRNTDRPGAARPIIWLAGLCVLLSPLPAFAHGGEGAIVLLLPTGYYIFGAAFTVAATFALVSLLPDGLTLALCRRALRLPVGLPSLRLVPNILSLVLLAIFVAAGFFGPRDPLHNPLPAFIWTVWWVCVTILQGVFGSLWQALDPWRAPLALVARWRGRGGRDGRRPATLPPGLGYGIAIFQFYAFAWFELVDIAPSDPQRLALAVTLYWFLNLRGMMIFGEAEWRQRAEPFSIFFGLIGRLSPFGTAADQQGRRHLALTFPAKRLFDLPPLPVSGVLFVLLTLATLSYDGLSSTFFWLSTIRVNPLEYPGRSAVMLSGTLGLLATFAAMATLFFATVMLGCRMAAIAPGPVLGRLVYAIIPISFAFQIAHYLTIMLVQLQNFAIALSDPFGRGWNLFGTADHHVTTSFLNVYDSVVIIFDIQTAAIALGHVLAVILAHAIVLDFAGSRRATLRAELPFAALMVGYTAFGLWLLATPRI